LPGIELAFDERLLAACITQQTIDFVNGIDSPFTAIDADPLANAKCRAQQRRAVHGVLPQCVGTIKYDLHITRLHT